ncbi:hypothetical protein [Rhizobium leguminosarum]|uniref:hypothetical protein n=1 Tax=Rhizobium leguminosarum TaxID=384 RepID=UPI001C926117|nr:hypothetical protein [Rhizobium leguminosarum]MBY3003948.1 hypothetical protein [Rhizobium leguminosarum]
MSINRLEQSPDIRREGQDGPPSKSNGPAPLSPLAVIALSAVGIILGGAIVLHFSPLGSLGRYQFLLLRSNTVVRMDTTSGDLSACYYGSGSIGQPATCFPWSQSGRGFMPPKDPGAIQ